jgi:glycosyl transferase family 25
MISDDSPTRGHVPLLVLTLAKATDRQRAFTEHAQKIGLVFDFVYGTDAREAPGDQLIAAIDENAILANKGRRLSPGEIACAISHREMFRQVITHGWAGALIFEDDVTIEPSIHQFILDIRNAAHAGSIRSEVIYLGGREGFEEARIALSLRSRLRWKSGIRIRKVLRTEHAIQRTCGYFISRGACKALIEREHTIVDVADAWEMRLRNGTLSSLWMTLPPIVRHPQDLHDSLIQRDRLALIVASERQTRLRGSLRHTDTWRACVRLLRRTVYFPLLRILG